MKKIFKKTNSILTLSLALALSACSGGGEDSAARGHLLEYKNLSDVDFSSKTFRQENSEISACINEVANGCAYHALGESENLPSELMPYGRIGGGEDDPSLLTLVKDEGSDDGAVMVRECANYQPLTPAPMDLPNDIGSNDAPEYVQEDQAKLLKEDSINDEAPLPYVSSDELIEAIEVTYGDHGLVPSACDYVVAGVAQADDVDEGFSQDDDADEESELPELPSVVTEKEK